MSDSEGSSSLFPTILLLFAAALGFGLSNSPYSSVYLDLLNTKIAFGVGQLSIFNKSLLLLINDGLMAIFFLFIGLELKRELVVGELSNIRRATLPIVAAIGGMLVPALIYFIFNSSGDAKSGWGIPMATDIAFALGILAVLGSKVPRNLKIMLAAIAIVDDLGAILVIAIFYTSELGLNYLGMAFLCYLLCIGLNRMRNQKISIYLLIGIPMWYFMLKSGVHATIAGVALAFTIPLSARDKNSAKTISDILDRNTSLLDSPALFLEKSLYKWVGLIIVPVFAFANAGVSLDKISFGSVSLGVIFGLCLGKPIGIFSFSYAAFKAKIVTLPDGVMWKHIAGLGCLAGIGFTMSLFIGSLAFTEPALFDEAKLAILIGSFISSIVGVVLLLKSARSYR